MSKSSFIVGLLLALAAHALLLVPLDTQADPDAPADPETPVSPVTMIDPPPPAPPAKPKPAPQPETKPQVKPRPKPAPEPPQLARTTPPPVPEPEPEPMEGNTTPRQRPESIDDDVLPPLRITWDSPTELRRVAGAMGMRIVAVNFQGKVLGEIDPDGKAELVEFNGSLAAYSNRVRTLPSGFFGTRLSANDAQVAELWILVPAAIDRAWMDMQKQAIARTGLAAEQVRSIEGRFASVPGGYRLVVTRIVSRPNGT